MRVLQPDFVDEVEVAGIVPAAECVGVPLPHVPPHDVGAASDVPMYRPIAPYVLIWQDAQFGAVIHAHHDDLRLRLLQCDAVHHEHEVVIDAFVVIVQNPEPVAYRRMMREALVTRPDAQPHVVNEERLFPVAYALPLQA